MLNTILWMLHELWSCSRLKTIFKFNEFLVLDFKCQVPQVFSYILQTTYWHVLKKQIVCMNLLDRNILLLKLNFHLFPCAYWLHFQSSCIFFNTYHYICAKPTSFILTNLTFDHLSYHDIKRTTQLKQANRRTLKDHPFFQNLNFYLTLFDLLWQIGSPTL